MTTLFNDKSKLHNLFETAEGRNAVIQVTFLNSLRQKLQEKKESVADDAAYLEEIDVDIERIDACIAELEQEIFMPQSH